MKRRGSGRARARTDGAQHSSSKQQSGRRPSTQDQASQTAGIADALVIKDGGLYFLCGKEGEVPCGGTHGLGLYYHDCRFLSGYELRIGRKRFEPLVADDRDGFRSVLQLTNPTIGPAGRGIDRQRIGLRWRHVLDARHQALRDDLLVENYDTKPHAVPLTLRFDADFRDIYVIRGHHDERPGTLRPPAWRDDELILAYDGADGLGRQLRIRFSEPPSSVRGGVVRFDVRLRAHEARRIIVSFTVVEQPAPIRPPITAATAEKLERAAASFARSIGEWMEEFVHVRSTSPPFDHALERSLRDLRALRMALDRRRFFAAGVPWFVTLFGRDSIVCALQMLAFRTEIAAETLRLLAHFQGERVDRWRDEEPGKILHELRIGELARMGKIPYTPYYGTVDATPLFLVLLAEYVRWTGDLALFGELSAAVDGALRWIDDYGDHDGDGYVDYSATAGHRLVNQGWKDSGNAIVDCDGSRAEPPIALVEVQGYVFRAKEQMAQLYERTGDAPRAAELRRQAADLRTRFNRDFWIEDERFYAVALSKGGHRVASITSNPGQALWTGIVDAERAPLVADRLLSEDMYSGWGIRTLSAASAAYNPIGYHLGTVWPHDNGLIAAGFRRYGFASAACRIFSGLLDAAARLPEHRLPEALAGYSRDDYERPVRYPTACHPQAWSSGAIPALVAVVLGLEPDALERRLRIVRPCLPSAVGMLELRGLRVGDAVVDLRFQRTKDGSLATAVERIDGELDVRIESAPAVPLP